jgi:hypothetical protein
MFIQRANILWLLVVRLSLIPNYLKERAARLCRYLYTDFREHLPSRHFGEWPLLEMRRVLLCGMLWAASSRGHM